MKNRLTLSVLLAALLLGTVPAEAAMHVGRVVAPAGSVPNGAAVIAPLSPVLPAASLTPSLNASLPPSFRAPADAPRLGDVLRQQAAADVAAWRAQRAAQPAAPEAAAAAPALSREEAAARAIIAAESPDAALDALVELGVIDGRTLPESPTDRSALLSRIWDRVSSKRGADVLPVDSSWAVPAIKVVRGGKTYYVHGVAHGYLYPPHRGQVIRLVKQIEKQGGALISEQNLPLHYGFGYGHETLDHAVTRAGQAAAVVKASARNAASQALTRAMGMGGTLAAWGYAALHNAEPLAWAVAVGLTGLLWLASKGFQPLMKRGELSRAASADAVGSHDLAQQIRREAKAFFGPPVSAEDIVRLHLPAAPGAAADPLSPRSAAMAEAAAAASGSVVHVLSGYLHAAEVAWRLAGYAPPAAAAAVPSAAKNGGEVRTWDYASAGVAAFGALGLILGQLLSLPVVTGVGAVVLGAAVLAFLVPRHFDRTPFGSYRVGTWQGRPARFYGWSLSPNTFFQAFVLGLTGGPIMWLLFGNSLAWSLGGMFFAPILVDLLKPTIMFDDSLRGRNGGAVGPARDLNMTELLLLNLAGIALSLYLGIHNGALLLGILGVYVMPIPVIFAYVVGANLLGFAIRLPVLRWAPSIKWFGKRDDNGGRLNAYYALSALMGAGLLALQPWTALAITALLGLLTLGDDMLRTRKGLAFPNADKRDKFIGFGIGSALMGAFLFHAGVYGAFVFLTPAVALLLAAVHYVLGKDKEGNGGRISQVAFFAILGAVVGLIGLATGDGWLQLGGAIWLGSALLGYVLNARRGRK